MGTRLEGVGASGVLRGISARRGTSGCEGGIAGCGESSGPWGALTPDGIAARGVSSAGARGDSARRGAAFA